MAAILIRVVRAAMTMLARNLGIASPSGKDVYEVYVQVKSRPSILGKLSDMLGARNIDILGAHVQVSDDRETGHVILYIEMKDSTVGIEELLKAVKEQGFVIDAKAESRQRIFFESMMFPITSGGHYRGFFVGASSWTALVDSMLKQFGSGAQVILQGEGAAVGRDVVQRIREKLGGTVDTRTLMDNIEALFRADGLGLLELSRGRSERISVTISDYATTTAPSSEPLIDYFLIGVVSGAGSKIFSCDYSVENPRVEDSKIKFTLLANRCFA